MIPVAFFYAGAAHNPTEGELPTDSIIENPYSDLPPIYCFWIFKAIELEPVKHVFFGNHTKTICWNLASKAIQLV